MSEDDIRTKVVYSWLKDCGITDSDIRIEYSIKLRLGKGTKVINSRCDVLVRNTANQNLLIVEVKSPDHRIVDADSKQAISYARSLAEGGIAPFTVLTNGLTTIIYDSVTGESIGVEVSKEHNYIRQGYRVSGDAIEAKAEALEYLISVSEENLLCFCKAQTEQRMRLLKSTDIYSGKKYIPQLYVNRKKVDFDLKNKLFNEKTPSNLVLVVGPPQHGKTCFLCKTVETYLDEGIPVLFYPAVSIRSSLLEEIKMDFDWTFTENNSQMHLVQKLNRITERIGKKIVLIVDGWNEMLDHAAQLNDDCQRITNSRIQLVLSTTSPSLTRLLYDTSGNLSFIGDEVKLNSNLIKNLSTKPLKNTGEISLVQIGTFDYNEIEIGKQLHQQAFNTKFTSESNLPKDPFYLRLAAESYSNSTVPSFATRTQLIKEGIVRKAQRRGIREIELFTDLIDFTSKILENDTPLSCLNLPAALRDDDRISLYTESAIMIKWIEKGIPEIDFYYTHDKDFCIAILNRKLDNRLTHLSDNEIYEEIIYLCQTESGKSALQWFLSCPEYCQAVEKIFKIAIQNNTKNSVIIKIISDSLYVQVALNRNTNFNWLESFIEIMLSSSKAETETHENLSVLIFSFLSSLDRKKENDKYKFWMRLLLKYDISIEELSVEESLICKYYGEDDIKNYFEDTRYTTLDLELFEQFVIDRDAEVAENAAKVLTYAYPLFMQQKIPLFFNLFRDKNLNHNYILENSCETILAEKWEAYYGSMCPGWLTYAEKGDEDVKEEFETQKKLWWPILRIIDVNTKLYNDITDILSELSKYVAKEEKEIFPFYDPNQLTIELDDHP